MIYKSRYTNMKIVRKFGNVLYKIFHLSNRVSSFVDLQEHNKKYQHIQFQKHLVHAESLLVPDRGRVNEKDKANNEKEEKKGKKEGERGRDFKQR